MIVKQTFVAEDGTEFDDVELCRQYERTQVEQDLIAYKDVTLQQLYGYLTEDEKEHFRKLLIRVLQRNGIEL